MPACRDCVHYKKADLKDARWMGTKTEGDWGECTLPTFADKAGSSLTQAGNDACLGFTKTPSDSALPF